MFASTRGDTDAVSLLLEHGANASLQAEVTCHAPKYTCVYHEGSWVQSLSNQ